MKLRARRDLRFSGCNDVDSDPSSEARGPVDERLRFGDWNGDGRTKVGLFRQGFFWILDYNGNGVFEPNIDKVFSYGGVTGDAPVVGDWMGTGTSKVGIVRQGFRWILNANR